MGGLTINGRSGGFNFSYDGVTNKDTGSNSGNYAAPALDSIAEVRVQASNFQAEYGRSSGATISVITRSGTKNFHGSAAFYKRDDAWNGNEFAPPAAVRPWRHRAVRRRRSTLRQHAWTLGGPVLIPARLQQGPEQAVLLLVAGHPGAHGPRHAEPAPDADRARAQRRFFADLRRPEPHDPHSRPADLGGNCNSVSRRTGCFANNRIPASRINPTAQALLNLFPLPNATDPTGANNYNYTFQTVQDWPRNDQVLRMDWNVGPTRPSTAGCSSATRSARARLVPRLDGAGWPQQPSKYEIDTVSYVNTLLHTFNPSTFAEFTVGVNWWYQHAARSTRRRSTTTTDTSSCQACRSSSRRPTPNLLPQASFSGLPANTTDRVVQRRAPVPFFGYNRLWNFSGNLTKIKGAHNVKTGSSSSTRRARRSGPPVQRQPELQHRRSAPLNTNIGFANALIGAVTQYQESDGHPSAHGQFINTEFYVQDNWRVNRNWTIDAGVRFYYITPTQSEGDEVAAFEPGRVDALGGAAAVPARLDCEGRRAQDPADRGDPAGDLHRPAGAGIRQLHQRHGGVRRDAAAALAVQGRAPYRVRVGRDRRWQDRRSAAAPAPSTTGIPTTTSSTCRAAAGPNTYTLNYTTLPDLLSNPLTATPTAVRHIDEFTPPVVYNWSLGVQREIGFQLVADMPTSATPRATS